MKQIYTDSIAKAKSLYDGFDDVIHDVAHSRRVAENAALIAKEIGYADTDFLELCAYWHDTARTEGADPHEEPSAILARDDLIKRGATKEEANRAYEGIRFHKSSAHPTTIEGKIIRDADKLDIFSVERWSKCVQAGWRKDYVEDFRRTITSMDKYPAVFTYDFAKKLYKDRLPAFLAFYEPIKNTLPE